MATHYLVGIGAQAVKLAAKEISPIAIEKLKALFSDRILIVGDQKCGKTSFIDYLRTTVLVDEKLPRRRTIDITRSPSIKFNIGDQGQFQATIKTCMEIPGHSPTIAQDTIGINPNGLIIMLDMSKSVCELEIWLSKYCDQLEDEYRKNLLGLVNEKIKLIVLLLNKVDKISETDLHQYQETLGKIVRNKLNHARGNIDREDILILPCCCVANPKGSNYIDNVIYSIIMRLQK